MAPTGTRTRPARSGVGMRLVCAYTNLHPETRAALDASGRPWEAADVSGSPTAYYDLLSRLWSEQADFALIEHDVVPTEATFDAFESCPEPWCSAPAETSTGTRYWWAACLQANRWRASVMADHRDVLEGLPLRAQHWGHLDGGFLGALTHQGQRVHVHAGTGIRHLHRYGAEDRERQREMTRWLNDQLHQEMAAWSNRR